MVELERESELGLEGQVKPLGTLIRSVSESCEVPNGADGDDDAVRDEIATLMLCMSLLSTEELDLDSFSKTPCGRETEEVDILVEASKAV